MERNEVDKLEKEPTKETVVYFNTRDFNDLIDGRVPYQNKKENMKMISKDKYKVLKNIFVDKKGDEIFFKIFKDKYTEMPESDGDIFGPLELNKCDTPDKMLGQIRYLTGFEWCTSEIIDQFLHTVEATHVVTTGKTLFNSFGR